MNSYQKSGGYAALINAAAYIIGFGMIATLLSPIIDATADEYLAFLAANQTLMIVWHIIIYLVAGVFMVPLSLGLHERLKAKTPALMQNATVFGLIWAGLIIASGMLFVLDVGVVTNLYATDPAQASTVWITLSAVETALGGGIELTGGVWVLLVSLAALRGGGLPRLLNYLGVIIGAAGIVTVLPVLHDAASIFGLGFIVWFTWVGIVMLRSHSSVTA